MLQASRLMLDKVLKAMKFIVDSLLWLPNKTRLVDREKLRATTHYVAQADIDFVLGPQQTQERISSMLVSSGPFLVARFGSTELRMILRQQARRNRSIAAKIYGLMSRFESPVWVPWEHTSIRKKSGFYPVSREATDRFADLMINSMKHVDLLGSWVPGENQLRHYFPQAIITSLSSLSPFGFEEPWTTALQGKKILVVHPFDRSIQIQYEKRNLLFQNPNFLPEFELKTFRAVQSLGTPPTAFPTWFDALSFMHRQIRKIDFDVALIGCGAFGFPLGARLKEDGKQAIVLGGLVQLLFGIKGKRWDDAGLYNEHWVRPLEAERPDGYLGADQGAYW